ncbi:MAG: glycogen synthase GlgA [Treponema sp.]|jgi:starch synthase|nr:glycogen synthase GlgA [Treponema sp.]
MKILMVTAEAAPFAKSGGLADMVSALSIALRKAGHDVRIVLPRYYSIDRGRLTQLEGPLGLSAGQREVWTAVYATVMPGTEDLPVYFIDHEESFGRDGIYGSPAEPDFHDNPVRFSVLCNAAFQICHKLNWTPDIIHGHDWPTALAPVLLKFDRRAHGFEKTASVFTIHNLGYQGVYPKQYYSFLGVNWEYFYDAGFEDWDHLNMLKAGLASSDMLTTVSPAYAREITTPEGGFHMEGILRRRQDRLAGILNGVDTDIWNPAQDKHLAKKYSYKTPAEGKIVNKKTLQQLFSLEENETVPIIGIVTRLADQKGIAELFGPAYGCMYRICTELKVQVVVLGSGEPWCEQELRALEHKLPNFRAFIGYDEVLSHRIEAGSDFFLMPSRYEPCGLNQMYSLLYGSLPIVRRTGGLADTVTQYNQETGEGTGFLFDYLSPQSVFDTVFWAVWTWYNKPKHIAVMRERGMKQQFGWDVAARKYAEVYEKALSVGAGH